MFSKASLLFIATLCVFCAAEENAITSFKDDVAKAAEKAKELGDHITEMLGLKNLPPANELVNLIKDQAKNFVEQVEQVQHQLDHELKQVTNSTLAEGFQEFNKKVLETLSTVRTQVEASPVTEKALDLQGKFQDGITALLDESKKLAIEFEPQVMGMGAELGKLAKKVLDDAVDNLDQLQGKIHTATGHSHH